LTTSPLNVALMAQLLPIDEQHPSDIVFLPDVNDLDAGYLFVTEEFVFHRVTVYRWEPGRDLAVQGRIFQGFPTGGPNLVFVDRVGADYFLGIASNNWGWGELFRVRDTALFPNCAKGSLNVGAFEPQGMFPFPVLDGPSQVKLVRDAEGR